MEATKNTPALILNRRPYRENDGLVAVYTLKFGKQTLLARGVKKPRSKLAGHLEPLTLAEVMIIYGRGRDYIGSAATVNAYGRLKSDLNKLYCAGRALDWFNRLVKDNVRDEKLFALLTAWLETVDVWPAAATESLIRESEGLDRERGELLFAFFAWQLMAALGYRPELYKCLICGQKIKAGNNYFDLSRGGLVGGECAGKMEKGKGLILVADNVIKLLRVILENKFAAAAKLKVAGRTVKETSALTLDFLNYHG